MERLYLPKRVVLCSANPEKFDDTSDVNDPLYQAFLKRKKQWEAQKWREDVKKEAEKWEEKNMDLDDFFKMVTSPTILFPNGGKTSMGESESEDSGWDTTDVEDSSGF